MSHVEAGAEMRQDFVVQLTAAKVAMEVVLAGVAVCFRGGRLRDLARGNNREWFRVGWLSGGRYKVRGLGWHATAAARYGFGRGCTSGGSEIVSGRHGFRIFERGCRIAGGDW